uniref:PlsC domain-containing protein n=1 Tax=Bursaphelenchus xylophilus TaxID=6326 RepID=A0A1I7SH86_BURXY
MGVKMEKSSSALESNSTMDLRKMMTIVGAFYWFIMTVIVVPVGCLCTLFLVLYPIMGIVWLLGLNKQIFNGIEHIVCQYANDHWVSAGQYTGLTITEHGDDITEIADSRALFLCNHLGLVDHFCLMTAFWDKKGLTGKYMWVIFNIWKWTPLGAMWTTHGNFFINGGRTKRDEVLREFGQHLRNNYWEYDYGWVVMYPEGSRLYLVKEQERKFAEKMGIEPFKHCSHPRTGAAHTTLTVCGKNPQDPTKANAGDLPPMEYVIDCTLGYPKGEVVDISKAMLGEWPNDNSHVAVHYSIHKVKPEWADEAKLKEWLYQRYAEKVRDIQGDPK